jgi:hypothetical protein
MSYELRQLIKEARGEFFGASDSDERSAARGHSYIKPTGPLKNSKLFKAAITKIIFTKDIKEKLSDSRVTIEAGNSRRATVKAKAFKLTMREIDKLLKSAVERFNKVYGTKLRLDEFKTNSFVIDGS